MLKYLIKTKKKPIKLENKNYEELGYELRVFK